MSREQVHSLGGNKVLVIAYNFPPHGGVGVQRSLKFVKYLPEFGWRPIVVAGDANAGSVRDDSLLNELPPEAIVTRVPGFSMRQFTERMRRNGLRRVGAAANVLSALPDGELFWSFKAREAVKQILESEQPDLIYTTSAPYSSHLLGLWVKRRYGLPWMADFRDPWSEHIFSSLHPPGYRAINRRMERQVLTEADRIVCVTESWLNDLWRNLGKQREKFLVIPNGYDDDDILPSPVSKGEQFVVSHTGTLYHNRRSDIVVAAIDRLIENNRIAEDSIRVVFVGRNTVHRIPRRPPFEAYDFVPHDQLVEFRIQTDVFLLLLPTGPENRGHQSAKLFEYIASGRPILGIVPPGGSAEELIQTSGAGIAVSDDIDEVMRALEMLYRRWQQGNLTLNPDPCIIEQYSRRCLTQRLAAEFKAMLGETPPGEPYLDS